MDCESFIMMLGVCDRPTAKLVAREVNALNKIVANAKTEAIDDFSEYLKKNFRIGVNTIDEVVKSFKEEYVYGN